MKLSGGKQRPVVWEDDAVVHVCHFVTKSVPLISLSNMSETICQKPAETPAARVDKDLTRLRRLVLGWTETNGRLRSGSTTLSGLTSHVAEFLCGVRAFTCIWLAYIGSPSLRDMTTRLLHRDATCQAVCPERGGKSIM